MKKPIIFISLTFFGLNSVTAQVGIGTNTPNASSILELQSTDKGFLPPRMTTSERDGISSPAEGLMIYNSTNKALEFFDGTNWISASDGSVVTTFYSSSYVHCGAATEVVEVTSPITSKIWMDRNLGASRAALSNTDAQSYGSLFQWGRGADGHQCVHRFTGDGVTTSGTTTTLSSTDQPGNGLFIIVSGTTTDWRSTPNNDLWQGVNGINNPCPQGFKVPSEAEWIAEQPAWNNPSTGVLNLSLAGGRLNDNGGLDSEGSSATYWTSNIDGNNARRLGVFQNPAFMSLGRSYGFSVRCIKN